MRVLVPSRVCSFVRTCAPTCSVLWQPVRPALEAVLNQGRIEARKAAEDAAAVVAAGGGGASSSSSSSSSSSNDHNNTKTAAFTAVSRRRKRFSAISSELNDIFFHYPFTVPEYFALVTRALIVLEGIALTGDPEFDIFRAACVRA